jgi:hypothetical protein
MESEPIADIGFWRRPPAQIPSIAPVTALAGFGTAGSGVPAADPTPSLVDTASNDDPDVPSVAFNRPLILAADAAANLG